MRHQIEVNATGTIDKIRANVRLGLIVKILGDECGGLIFSDTHRTTVLKIMKEHGANFIADLDTLEASSIYNLKSRFVEFAKLNRIESELTNLDNLEVCNT